MSQIKIVLKWSCFQVSQWTFCTISVTVHFLLSNLSASPQTILGAGISTGICGSKLRGDVHTGPKYWACHVYVLSVFHFLEPHVGTGNTQTTDLKCVFVMLYGIYKRCGPPAHLWHAQGEASQRFSWRAVVELVLSPLGKWLQCLTIVLIYETHVRTVEYTCGLVCTLPCHFLFPGRQMQGRW